jgi:hypothetical protein
MDLAMMYMLTMKAATRKFGLRNAPEGLGLP